MASMLERLGLRRRTTASPPPIGVVGAAPHPKGTPKKAASGTSASKPTPKRDIRPEHLLGSGTARSAAMALKNRRKQIDEAAGL